MLVKEAIVEFFEEKNIENIFHLPGIHTLPLNDVLSRSTIEIITGRHEANIGFMADGFARATGKPGVVLVTPGPGLGNLATACMEAHGSDIPLVIIFVDVEQKDVEKGVLHGVARPEEMFKPISKRFFVVADGNTLPTTLEEAYRTAVTPRRGPVVLSIPYRLLNRECSSASSAFRASEASGRTEIDPYLFRRTLQGKKRPVIVGGGALMDEKSAEILDSVCRDCGIPFFTTTSGKGVLSEDREYVFGNVIAKGATREIMKSADITIALGTRLRDVDTRRRGVTITSLVHADVDAQWIGRNYRADAQLAGDMRDIAASLGAALTGKRFSWNIKELHEARRRERSALNKDRTGFQIVELLRRCIPDDTVTIWDLNLIGYWAEYYFPVLRQRTFLMACGMSPIFYAFPAAIGARTGEPDTPCLCITGDASFIATAEELVTIKEKNLPVVVLVYNNAAFGILEEYMQKRYGISGSMTLATPDFPALARAFDVKAARAETLGELEHIFLHDVTWTEPFLVEFRFPLFSPPWE